MSARNGDKARFGKQRKRKMAHRARTQELREGLKAAVPGAAPVNHLTAAGQHEEGKLHDGHHGPLDTAAGATGSVPENLSPKVTSVKTPEPATAEK
jgi:hypothetical protein